MFRPWVSVRKRLSKNQFRRRNLGMQIFQTNLCWNWKFAEFILFKFLSLKSSNCIKVNCKKWLGFWIRKLNYSPHTPHEGTNLVWRCFVFIRKCRCIYTWIAVHLSIPCAANLGTGIKVAWLRKAFKFKLVITN